VRRLVALVVLACLASPTFAQKREGTYSKTPWQINEHHTLIWGGQPYIPVGIRIDGNAAAVVAATQSKVQDVLVDLPASGMGWSDTLKALDDNKLRYLLRVNSMAPMAHGFAVEPQGYRIPGIDKATRVEIALPGAQSAFVVLAAKRDGSVDSKARVPVINGKLVYDADPGPEYEHVLLIYPEMTSAEQPDYWEELDGHRDALLSSLKRNELGAGLRGIVNPLGRTVDLPGRDLDFVPTSRYFRMELRNHSDTSRSRPPPEAGPSEQATSPPSTTSPASFRCGTASAASRASWTPRPTSFIHPSADTVTRGPISQWWFKPPAPVASTAW
jgi:hypothetical protein